MPWPTSRLRGPFWVLGGLSVLAFGLSAGSPKELPWLAALLAPYLILLWLGFAAELRADPTDARWTRCG